MSILCRMIGKLTGYKNVGVSALINACDKLSPSSFTNTSDCSVAVSELIKYQRTNTLIHKIITSHFQNTSKNLVLETSTWDDMILYLNQGLLTRDMHAVDSAINLMWNNYEHEDFPLMKILRTLISTKPIGTVENQKLWRKIVSELAFHAIPHIWSPEEAKQFLTFYGKYPENFVNLIKYSAFFMSEKHCQLIEKLKEIEISDEPKTINKREIEERINSKGFTYEEETEFRNLNLLLDSKIKLDDLFEDELEEVVGSELYKRSEKFMQDYYKKNPATGNLSNEDWNFNMKDIKNEKDLEDAREYIEENEDQMEFYRIKDYAFEELLYDCLIQSQPSSEDLEKLENWFGSIVKNNQRVFLSTEVMKFIVIAARNNNNDNFLGFLFHYYPYFSSFVIDPFLCIETVRIISESNVKGDRAEAAFKVLDICYLALQDNFIEIGPFVLDTVPDNFIKCYIKEDRTKEAVTLFIELTNSHFEFSEDLIEFFADYFRKENCIQGLEKLLELSLTTKARLEIRESKSELQKLIDAGKIKNEKSLSSIVDPKGDQYLNYFAELNLQKTFSRNKMPKESNSHGSLRKDGTGNYPSYSKRTKIDVENENLFEEREFNEKEIV